MKRNVKNQVKPVMLGTLKIGARFIFDSFEWEILQQDWSKVRKPEEGKARCRKVNTPVIINIQRSNFVLKA